MFFKEFIAIITTPFIALSNWLFPTPPPPPRIPAPVVIERTIETATPVYIENSADRAILLEMLNSVKAIQEQVDKLPKFGGSFNTGEVVALFEDSLASGITASSTTFTLVRGTNKEGTALASSTYGMIIAEGGADEELVLADCTSTACTNVTRGLSVVTGTTSIYANIKAHRRGDSVKITDAPILLFTNNVFKGRQNIENIIEYSSANTFSKNNQIISKKYADDLAIAGAPDSSVTVKGIVEQATRTEVASTTSAGGTTAPLFIPSTAATSTPGGAQITGSGNTYVVVSEDDGRINQQWLDQSENFSWTGRNTFGTATTSFKSQTTFDDRFYATSTEPSEINNLQMTNATTTSLAVSNTASTSALIISNSCTGCFKYTASSTSLALTSGTKAMVAMPATANFGIANYTTTVGGSSYDDSGTIFLSRDGPTSTGVGPQVTGGGGDVQYTISITPSTNTLSLSEDIDDGGTSSLAGTIYWYR